VQQLGRPGDMAGAHHRAKDLHQAMGQSISALNRRLKKKYFSV
jgi:hypothetical protein